MSKDKTPKVKSGPTPRTIQEAQPKAVPMRYAMATGMTNAIGKNKSTYNKGK